MDNILKQDTVHLSFISKEINYSSLQRYLATSTFYYIFTSFLSGLGVQ